MAENLDRSRDLDRPRSNDAVLGGYGAFPSGAVVLGGLERVRQRLKSKEPEQRAAALADSLQYGERGLNLVIRALQDRSEIVQQTAYSLLRERSEPKVRHALRIFTATGEGYRRLQHALSTGAWQDADQETKVLLFNACGVSLSEQLRASQIAKFACEDLQILDELWIRYSRGRFGFSVQRSIWRKINARFWDKAEVWRAFGDRVGWRASHLFSDNHWKRFHEITFASHAPVGHLPFLGDKFGIFTVEAFANRLNECDITGGNS